MPQNASLNPKTNPNSSPLKVIFFGNEQLTQGIKAKTFLFDTLLEHNNCQLLALFLTNPNPRKPFPIAKRAEQKNVPIFYPKDPTETLQLIKNLKPDLGILASYGRIIPKTVLDAFPLGVLNLHPSLLPKYRGTTPIETALLNNDNETGISLMRLVPEMDAGPLLAQTSLKIAPEATKQQLYEQLSSIGAEILSNYLDPTKKMPLEAPQDASKATYTQKLDKSLSELKPSAKPAKTLKNEIRAFAGFPKSKITLKGIPCTITAAHVAKAPTHPEIDLCCADNNYLIIDRLIPENSREMDAKSFLNGLH